MMKLDGYLRISVEWAVRARRELVRCSNDWERAKGTSFGGDTGVGRIAGRDSGSPLGSGSTLGSGDAIRSGATLRSGITLGSG